MESHDINALPDLTALANRQELHLSVNLNHLQSLREIPTAHARLHEVLRAHGWICPKISKLHNLYGIVVELIRIEADLSPRLSDDLEDTEVQLLLGNAATTIVRRAGDSLITKRLKNGVLCVAREIQEAVKEVENPGEGVTEERIHLRVDALRPVVTRLLDEVPVSFEDPPPAVAMGQAGGAVAMGQAGGAVAMGEDVDMGEEEAEDGGGPQA